MFNSLDSLGVLRAGLACYKLACGAHGKVDTRIPKVFPSKIVVTACVKHLILTGHSYKDQRNENDTNERSVLLANEMKGPKPFS